MESDHVTGSTASEVIHVVFTEPQLVPARVGWSKARLPHVVGPFCIGLAPFLFLFLIVMHPSRALSRGLIDKIV